MPEKSECDSEKLRELSSLQGTFFSSRLLPSPIFSREMETLMTSSTLPPLYAEEDGSKESSDLATTWLTNPEIPYGSGATSSTNNPEFVEGLSQGQLLQNEPSDTAEGIEQRGMKMSKNVNEEGGPKEERGRHLFETAIHPNPPLQDMFGS